MGSGRGDRNQRSAQPRQPAAHPASMGSGRGDRNQSGEWKLSLCAVLLQWGPVVVTGIRSAVEQVELDGLTASMGSGRGDRNQGSR